MFTMRISMLFSSLFILMMFASCEGPEGPQGPQGQTGEQGVAGQAGPAGPQGVQGADGNANVRLFTFDGHDFTASTAVSYNIENTSKEEFDKTLYLIFMGQSDAQREIWFSMPGFGALQQTEYNSIMRYFFNNTRATATIFRPAGSGPGEVYEAVKIFAIESTETSRINLADIDLTDYEEVARHFGFKE